MDALTYYKSLLMPGTKLSPKRAKQEPYYSVLLESTKFLPEDSDYRERIYCFVNDIVARPTCKLCDCDNVVNFPHNLRLQDRHYRDYCSVKCMNRCPNTQSKKAITCLKNYGVENPSQNEGIKRQKEITITSNYGGYGVYRTDEWYNSDGVLYIIKVTSESEEFFKVGITSKTVSKRYPRSGDLMKNYNYVVVHEEVGKLRDLVKKEQSLIKSGVRYVPQHYFGGTSECLTLYPLSPTSLETSLVQH